MITADEKRTTLLTLYPLFKEEVYRRREQMMRWTAIGAGSLFAILLLVLLTPAARQLTVASRVLLCSGVLLLTTTFVTLILQQRRRHQQAKHTSIELEKPWVCSTRTCFSTIARSIPTVGKPIGHRTAAPPCYSRSWASWRFSPSQRPSSSPSDWSSR